MKLKSLLILILSPLICSAVLASSGMTIKKATYLGLDRYGKLEIMMSHFMLTPQDQKVLKYDNLLTSAPFRLVGTSAASVSTKLMTAAKKAVKQYELDSRENGQALVASVVYENDENTEGGENAWAVLLSRGHVSTSGRVLLEPVVIYSIERNTQGEKLVRISHRLDGSGI